MAKIIDYEPLVPKPVVTEDLFARLEDLMEGAANARLGKDGSMISKEEAAISFERMSCCNEDELQDLVLFVVAERDAALAEVARLEEEVRRLREEVERYEERVVYTL